MPLRLLRPKALSLLLAQLLQASQKLLRQGRAIANGQIQGVFENLHWVWHFHFHPHGIPSGSL